MSELLNKKLDDFSSLLLLSKEDTSCLKEEVNNLLHKSNLDSAKELLEKSNLISNDASEIMYASKIGVNSYLGPRWGELINGIKKVIHRLIKFILNMKTLGRGKYNVYNHFSVLCDMINLDSLLISSKLSNTFKLLNKYYRNILVSVVDCLINNANTLSNKSIINASMYGNTHIFKNDNNECFKTSPFTKINILPDNIDKKSLIYLSCILFKLYINRIVLPKLIGDITISKKEFLNCILLE